MVIWLGLHVRVSQSFNNSYLGNIMKTKIYVLLLLGVLVSCNTQTKKTSDLTANATSESYTGPIIDMHIHSFGEGNPLFGMTHPPTLRGEIYQGVASPSEQKAKTLELFKKHKVVKAMVSDGESWYQEFPEIVLIGGANTSVEALRKQHEEGKLDVLGEMAPFYQGILANDPAILPYFELGQELDIPVGFHIFPGGPNYGVHLLPEMLGGMRTYNANPLQLEDALVQFPDVRVYIMHGGWPYTEDVKALMYAHPNVYVDIAVLNWILPKEEFYDYLRSLINSGFGDRIMFGTDQMVWPELIVVAVETVNTADFLTLEQKAAIFYDNAAKFLGLTDKEMKTHKSK